MEQCCSAASVWMLYSGGQTSFVVQSTSQQLPRTIFLMDMRILLLGCLVDLLVWLLAWLSALLAMLVSGSKL